jgi:hypothetical protein
MDERIALKKYCIHSFPKEGEVMKSSFKAIGFAFGAALLFVSPLMAMPQYCPNAKPGCAGSCHGDEQLKKCPKAKGINQTPEVLKGFIGLESLKK